MIEQTGKQLRKWLEKEIDIPVVPSLPLKESKQLQLILYLLEILPAAKTYQSRSSSIRIKLRYLAAVAGDDAAKSESVWDQFIQLFWGHPDYEMILEPPDVRLWQSLGLTPRPCVLLDVPAQQHQPGTDFKRINSPIEIHSLESTRLFGTLFGPNDIPIPGAKILLENHNMTTKTNARGQFNFHYVPLSPRKKQITVQTRSEDFHVELDASKGESSPLEIRLGSLEG